MAVHNVEGNYKVAVVEEEHTVPWNDWEVGDLHVGAYGEGALVASDTYVVEVEHD